MSGLPPPTLDAVRGLLQRGEWSQAQVWLRQILAEDRTSAQAWLWLGETLERQGQRAAAWRCMDRAWMLDPQAEWAEAAHARLASQGRGPVPEWLTRLLWVPKVRVVGVVLARDEEENMGRCLTQLRPAVDQVVVVDTGSTDRTPQVAAAMGAEVVTTTWEDDFGKARNAAFPFLGEDGWALWVDADEFLHPEDVEVPRVVAGLYGVPDPPLLLRVVQNNHVGGSVVPSYDTVRMHPLGKGLTWRGRIHEQLTFAQGTAPAQVGVVRVRLEHWGYERDVVERRGKLARNLRLLRQWVREEPESVSAWAFLGRDLYVAGQLEEAVEALRQAESLDKLHPGYGRMAEVRFVLCEALVRLERLEEAQEVAERLVDLHPDFPGGWFWKAHVSLRQAVEAAKRAYHAAQKTQELASGYRGPVSLNPEVPTFLAPVVEADALRMLGRWDEALARYRHILKVRPGHPEVVRQVDAMLAQARRMVKGSSSSRNPPTV
jgi:tetratricopeptide (TPR) repeat protein